MKISPQTADQTPAQTPAQYVIAHFGGVRATARAIGVTAAAVSRWQKTGQVPQRQFARIRAAATGRGISLMRLVGEQ